MTDEIASHEMPATPPDPALSAAREDKINIEEEGRTRVISLRESSG